MTIPCWSVTSVSLFLDQCSWVANQWYSYFSGSNMSHMWLTSHLVFGSHLIQKWFPSPPCQNVVDLFFDWAAYEINQHQSVRGGGPAVGAVSQKTLYWSNGGTASQKMVHHRINILCLPALQACIRVLSLFFYRRLHEIVQLTRAMTTDLVNHCKLSHV